ncbi:C40 family peptidase [Acrocarpospora catenulata]|uniref:C40 family peptidase n=1 Tax=Acrocarpospora catenulata TaxID=2836182 RepID=UPI0027E096D0|nr:NlpC/P60 family protein [Acrocarpospora catenulata]
MKRWWLALGTAGLLVVPGSTILDNTESRVLAAAYALLGRFPYSWGGGHAETPGPSRGTCKGYRGDIKPCPARKTRGLDCSGLARWVYHIAHGRDVLGPGNTDAHLKRLYRVTTPRPGDLVFYGTPKRTHHVGIYIGHTKMINAYATGTRIRIDNITTVDDLLGYYRY